MKASQIFNKKAVISILFIFKSFTILSQSIIIPMDSDAQKNHLKAYGLTYFLLQNNIEVDWLLNYRGGSFLCKYVEEIEKECIYRGISYEIKSQDATNNIFNIISAPNNNFDIVKLEKAPKIAVYSPKNKQPWDDAVTMVLEYAEIPYDVIYDTEILKNLLPIYDWLHLHHEDFTGQYGKFYRSFKNASWYIEQKKIFEEQAKEQGFKKVSKQKLAVIKKIKEYTAGGGFLFAMCSATDTYDIALASEKTDICEYMFDGDPADKNATDKLNFNETFAFENFTLVKDPMVYEYSDIDMTDKRRNQIKEENDFFTLFEFSAKWDPIPTMLCQNHTKIIKGFIGQTTAFNKNLIKSNVLVMGENKALNEARYIHGEYGLGTWTFYGGHDPEDYKHRIGDPKTELILYPNSPGYRLILNNILFPAAKKKKRKT
ncbi:asparagine synthetase B [Flavobacteriales bacterium]|nr:asparagine synthetase B [Flavobacteriales bacterium]